MDTITAGMPSGMEDGLFSFVFGWHFHIFLPLFLGCWSVLGSKRWGKMAFMGTARSQPVQRVPGFFALLFYPSSNFALFHPPATPSHSEHHPNFLAPATPQDSAKLATMPRWDEIRDDLFEAIIQVQPAISKEQQMEIVRIMQARGHDMGWNAIRYVSYSDGLFAVAAGRKSPSRVFWLFTALS